MSEGTPRRISRGDFLKYVAAFAVTPFIGTEKDEQPDTQPTSEARSQSTIGPATLIGAGIGTVAGIGGAAVLADHAGPDEGNGMTYGAIVASGFVGGAAIGMIIDNPGKPSKQQRNDR